MELTIMAVQYLKKILPNPIPEENASTSYMASHKVAS